MFLLIQLHWSVYKQIQERNRDYKADSMRAWDQNNSDCWTKPKNSHWRFWTDQVLWKCGSEVANLKLVSVFNYIYIIKTKYLKLVNSGNLLGSNFFKKIEGTDFSENYYYLPPPKTFICVRKKKEKNPTKQKNLSGNIFSVIVLTGTFSSYTPFNNFLHIFTLADLRSSIGRDNPWVYGSTSSEVR